MEMQLGVITGQYRRLLSSCIVRAQAQRLISRIGVISPEARLSSHRWEVVGLLERELREEQRSHKMATCHRQASEGRVGQEGDVATSSKDLSCQTRGPERDPSFGQQEEELLNHILNYLSQPCILVYTLNRYHVNHIWSE